MEKGSFLADLGLLLWPKREQGDKSESGPLLHTFIKGGNIFCFAKEMDFFFPRGCLKEASSSDFLC